MRATSADLAAFIGGDGTTDIRQADKLLEVATLMVRAYTRGNGFTSGSYVDIDEPDLVAVVLSCAARLGANPTFKESVSVDDGSLRFGTFDGWTLPELAILHNYRRRTA